MLETKITDGANQFWLQEEVSTRIVGVSKDINNHELVPTSEDHNRRLRVDSTNGVEHSGPYVT